MRRATPTYYSCSARADRNRRSNSASSAVLISGKMYKHRPRASTICVTFETEYVFVDGHFLLSDEVRRGLMVTGSRLNIYERDLKELRKLLIGPAKQEWPNGGQLFSGMSGRANLSFCITSSNLVR